MIGLGRLFSRLEDAPLPELDLAAYLPRVQEVVGTERLQLIAVHSLSPTRGRLYLHVFAEGGTQLAFAKLSVAGGSEDALEHEARALEELSTRQFTSFRTPRLLRAYVDAPPVHLLWASLPEGERMPAVWDPRVAAAHAEIRGDTPVRRRLEVLSWWPAFCARAEEAPELATHLDAMLSSEVRVAAAHGDFVNWNMLWAEGQLWLFDWESYAPDAPWRADELRFYLGCHERRANRAPHSLEHALLEHFAPHRSVEDLEELWLALAFLHGRGVQSATAIARHLGRAGAMLRR